MNEWWILIPLVGALTGWLMVKLLIYLLFYPQHPKKIAGFSLQGLLPKRQAAITAQLTEIISGELSSFSEIEQLVLSTGNFERLIPEVEVHIDHFLSVKLKEKMPMVGMLVGERTLAQLKKIFMDEIEELFPVIMKSYLAGMIENLDMKKMVADRLLSLSTEKFSTYLSPLISKQLKNLPLIGAALGFFIGVLNMLIILFFYK